MAGAGFCISPEVIARTKIHTSNYALASALDRRLPLSLTRDAVPAFVLLGGVAVDYKSRHWRDTRNRILRRDKHQCQSCRRYGRAVNASIVHHVFPVSDYPDFAWASWNLVSLCPACHNAMHVRDTDALTDAGFAWCRRVSPPSHLPHKK